MIDTDITKEKFDEISKTGYQVVILRDTEQCDCVKHEKKENDDGTNFVDDSLLLDVVDEIELADPSCKKCFGTGRKLFPILTNKIRVTIQGSSISANQNLEVQLIELIKDDALIFYFPYNYEFLTLRDYIAIPKLDSKNNVILPVEYTEVYKIKNIEMFVRNDFKFYKVYSSKKKVI